MNIRMTLQDMENQRPFEDNTSILMMSDYQKLEKVFRKFSVGAALKETNGNQLQAAKLIGINRNTFKSWMKEFNIETPKNL